MHRSFLRPWISGHSSLSMKKPNILKSKRSSFDAKPELKIGMEQEIKKAADVDFGCYEKVTFKSRSFSKIQKYIASTQRSPSIFGIMNHKNQVASNTVDICKQFNNFFITVFDPSDVFDNQIGFESKSLNTLLITKEDVAKILGNLHVNNSTGPNKIRNLLRNIADEFSKYLRLKYQIV